MPTRAWKFARAWTLGEVVTALLGADLRLERLAEYPVDWWGGHADVQARRARPDPVVVLGDRSQGTGLQADGRRPGEPASPDRPSSTRLTLRRSRMPRRSAP